MLKQAWLAVLCLDSLRGHLIWRSDNADSASKRNDRATLFELVVSAAIAPLSKSRSRIHVDYAWVSIFRYLLNVWNVAVEKRTFSMSQDEGSNASIMSKDLQAIER